MWQDRIAFMLLQALLSREGFLEVVPLIFLDSEDMQITPPADMPMVGFLKPLPMVPDVTLELEEKHLAHPLGQWTVCLAMPAILALVQFMEALSSQGPPAPHLIMQC